MESEQPAVEMQERQVPGLRCTCFSAPALRPLSKGLSLWTPTLPSLSFKMLTSSTDCLGRRKREGVQRAGRCVTVQPSAKFSDLTIFRLFRGVQVSTTRCKAFISLVVKRWSRQRMRTENDVSQLSGRPRCRLLLWPTCNVPSALCVTTGLNLVRHMELTAF